MNVKYRNIRQQPGRRARWARGQQQRRRVQLRTRERHGRERSRRGPGLRELAVHQQRGLRVILTTAKSLQSSQRKFVICTLSNPIQDIFVISGFDQIINIQGSRAEALATMEA